MVAVLSGNIINILHYGFNHSLLPPATDSVMSHAASAEPLGIMNTYIVSPLSIISVSYCFFLGCGFCLGNAITHTNSGRESLEQMSAVAIILRFETGSAFGVRALPVSHLFDHLK